jgi:hypothetical protein
MGNELENIWKEGGRCVIELLFPNLLGGTDENHEEPELRWSVPLPRFQPDTFLIQLTEALLGRSSYSRA